MPEDIYRSPSLVLQPTLHSLVPQHCPGHETYTSIASNVPSKIYRPYWKPHASAPAITPIFLESTPTCKSSQQFKEQYQKIKNESRQESMGSYPRHIQQVTSQMLERQLIALSHIPPIKPSFLKWYNPNVHCDYHVGNSGHSTEDCNSLKYKVQTLIKVEKLNFESQDRLSDLSLNSSRARVEQVKPNIPRIENVLGIERLKEKEFATIGRCVQERMIGYTTEKTEEEKKASELRNENEEL